MPKVIPLIVTVKNELVTHIITRTGTRSRICTVLLLQFRI